MSQVYILFGDNDMVIEVEGVRNELTGGYQNDAAVSVTLRDSDGTAVDNETWPLTLAYVPGSNGIYRATLVDTLDLTAAARYTAELVVDGGPGLRLAVQGDCVCQVRR